MALDDSALLEMIEMLRTADGGELMQRPPNDRLTWGYRRAEILAAAAQAAVLLAVATYILVEAIRRLFDPSEIESGVMPQPSAPASRS